MQEAQHQIARARASLSELKKWDAQQARKKQAASSAGGKYSLPPKVAPARGDEKPVTPIQGSSDMMHRAYVEEAARLTPLAVEAANKAHQSASKADLHAANVLLADAAENHQRACVSATTEGVLRRHKAAYEHLNDIRREIRRTIPKVK